MHAPHVRTKQPVRGRMARRLGDARAHLLSTVVSRAARARGMSPRHSQLPYPASAHVVRRGPALGERSLPVDLTFRIAAAGVVLSAAVLGTAMGLAHPTWMLAAMLVAGGALVAAVVGLSTGRPHVGEMP